MRLKTNTTLYDRLYVMFLNIYNVLKLMLYLVQLRRKEYISREFSQEFVHTLCKCGCLAIKFAQWYVMRCDMYECNGNIKYKEFNKELLSTLESCPHHSYDYTLKVFQNDFGISLENLIKLDKCEPLASGSIGQVYLGTMQDKDKQRIVIKVRHPDLEKNSYILNIFIALFSKYFAKFIDVDNFIQCMYSQFDYIQEAENLKLMYNKYKNDAVIVIPQVYMSSTNIIVMSYEDGCSIHEVDDRILAYKAGLNILAFQRENASVHGCVHSDMHSGNWKIRRGNDDFKIVIFDMGLMSLCDKDKMNSWIKAYQHQDAELLVNITLEECDVTNADDNHVEILVKEIEQLVVGPPKMNKILSKLIPLLNSMKIKVSCMFLNCLVSFSLTEKSLETVTNKSYNDTYNKEQVYLTNCLDLLNYCQTYNTCHGLQVLLKEEASKLKSNEMFYGKAKYTSELSLETFYASYNNDTSD